MTKPDVIPPGEPDLATALLKASRCRGARYVHAYTGVSGWHTSDVQPRSIAAYFRVSGQKIWIRTAAKVETYWGRVVGDALIQEGTADGRTVAR